MLSPSCFLAPSLQDGQDGGGQPVCFRGARPGAGAPLSRCAAPFHPPREKEWRTGYLILVRQPEQAAGWQLSLVSTFLRGCGPRHAPVASSPPSKPLRPHMERNRPSSGNGNTSEGPRQGGGGVSRCLTGGHLPDLPTCDQPHRQLVDPEPLAQGRRPVLLPAVVGGALALGLIMPSSGAYRRSASR